MAAPSTAINLLTEDSFSKSPIGTVLLWALSVGRYVIVFTQLVVILSFLSRFKLDRDLTDLTSRITQQQAVITSYGDLEQRVREMQSKLAFLTDATSGSQPFEIITKLESLMPTDVRLTSISIRDQQLQLSAITLSPNGFSTFVRALQRDAYFQDIELVNVTSGDETDTSIAFDLRATVGEKQESITRTKKP